MKARLDCIPCFLRQALEAAKMSTDDEAAREEALRQVLSYLSREGWNRTTPELGTNVHRIVKRATGNNDPYKKLKDKYNRLASDLYPRLKRVVEHSEDPLLTAAKIAISGNAIDFGPRREINTEVKGVVQCELAVNDIK